METGFMKLAFCVATLCAWMGLWSTKSFREWLLGYTPSPLDEWLDRWSGVSLALTAIICVLLGGASRFSSVSTGGPPDCACESLLADARKPTQIVPVQQLISESQQVTSGRVVLRDATRSAVPISDAKVRVEQQET